MTTKIILGKDAMEFLCENTELQETFNDGILRVLFEKHIDNYVKKFTKDEFDKQLHSFMKSSTWADNFTGEISTYVRKAKEELRNVLRTKENTEFVKELIENYMKEIFEDFKKTERIQEIVRYLLEAEIKLVIRNNPALISSLIAEEVKNLISSKLK